MHPFIWPAAWCLTLDFHSGGAQQTKTCMIQARSTAFIKLRGLFRRQHNLQIICMQTGNNIKPFAALCHNYLQFPLIVLYTVDFKGSKYL